MQIGDKLLIMVGDRVLVQPDNPQGQTRVGLYLPQTVAEKEPVQTGRIVSTGPGLAVPNFTSDINEPWEESRPPVRYMPLQAQVGDYALFLRREAVEIQYEEERFLVISQSAILMLIRGDNYPPAE